ncbi:hypothetical protein EQV97_00075 [Pseudomonas sp. TMW22090]|nr:hypothetical protein [Pseudomonas sp. TMW22090]
MPDKLNPVGAAEGCDLLIFGNCDPAENQKIAAFGSSYRVGLRRAIVQISQPLLHSPCLAAAPGRRR